MAIDLRAGPWPVPAEEYHRDRSCVSHGALEEFRRSVPTYHGRYVAGTLPPREATEALRLGTAFHTLLLQPELFPSQCVIDPGTIKRRTKAGKAQWAQFLAAAGGRIILDDVQHQQLLAMRAAVLRAPFARKLIERKGPVEMPLRWRDPQTDLWCRCMPDKRLRGVLVDVKTAEDPTPAAWVRDAVRYGYHRQAAWYVEGARHGLGERSEFCFLAVGKAPPHEVAVYTLDEMSLDLARRQNEQDLADLARRRREGDWSSRLAGVRVVTLPRYAFED